MCEPWISPLSHKPLPLISNFTVTFKRGRGWHRIEFMKGRIRICLYTQLQECPIITRFAATHYVILKLLSFAHRHHFVRANEAKSMPGHRTRSCRTTSSISSFSFDNLNCKLKGIVCNAACIHEVKVSWVWLISCHLLFLIIVNCYWWLRYPNSGVYSFSEISPLVLDLMELSVKQNVMTSSVLLKSSTQLYSIRPHHSKLPFKESTDCPLDALSRSVSSWVP